MIKNKTKKNLIFIIAIGFIIMIIFIYNKKNETLKEKSKIEKSIKSHYSSIVVVNKDANLYIRNNNEYILSGIIKKNEIITLEKQKVTYQNEYFKIKELDNTYYINYQDVLPTINKPIKDERYKNYIPFNENIVTNNNVNFYNENGDVVYNIKKTLSLPIIIKYGESYGVIYNNRLLTIKKENVKQIVNNNNTNEIQTNAIAVLNYHFFYDGNSKEDSKKCNQRICLSTQNFKKHLDYIKDNNIFTPTMKELELYIDKKINLPKSVVLTIDDGWRADIGSKIITEYKLNATVFLITKEYPKENYENDYIEVHSHGNNLHNKGTCKGGQGGGIKCLPKNTLLEDLKTSRTKLNNTTVFCYPFYEYNDYSIEVLKEAGFKMAFAGPHENGNYKVTPGIDKFKLPRYVIYNNTTANNIKNYIG